MKKAAAILAFAVGISGFGQVWAQDPPPPAGLVNCGPFFVTPAVCAFLIATGVVVIAVASSSGGSGSSGTQ